MKKEQLISLHFRLSLDYYKAFKILCVTLGVSMQQEIEKLVKYDIDFYEKK